MLYAGCKLVMTFSKVLITGLGQLGLAAAKYVKERGFDTYGYDINTEAMEIARRSAGIKQVTDFGSHGFDVYIICVCFPILLRHGNPLLSSVYFFSLLICANKTSLITQYNLQCM